MLHLARAIVTAAAFLEFAEDDVLSPDDAVRALENMASDLCGAAPEEIEALRLAARKERDAQKAAGANAEVLKFYDQFVYNFGLEDQPSA